MWIVFCSDQITDLLETLTWAAEVTNSHSWGCWGWLLLLRQFLIQDKGNSLCHLQTTAGILLQAGFALHFLFSSFMAAVVCSLLIKQIHKLLYKFIYFLFLMFESRRLKTSGELSFPRTRGQQSASQTWCCDWQFLLSDSLFLYLSI